VKTNSLAVSWRVGTGLIVIALVVVAVLVTRDSPVGAQTAATEEASTPQTMTAVVEQEPQGPTAASEGLTMVPEDELSPMAKSCLATLDERLRAKGVPVLGVSTRVGDEGDARVVTENTDTADELPVVVVRIPLAAINDPDYIFTIKQIERQIAAMATAGAPIRIMGIVTVDEDSKQEQTFTMGLVSDMISAPEWKEPAQVEYTEAEASAKSIASEACAEAGLDLVSFGFSEDDLGRTLELSAVLGAGDSGNPGALVDAMESAVSGLNTESGAKIATVIVRVDDSAGSPVARATLDFGMTNSSFWLGPQYRGQTDMKPGILQ